MYGKTFYNIRVTFLCLQNGLPGKTMSLEGVGKVMVLPNMGFNPVIGENYLCFLRVGGQYTEGNKVFPVAHATPYSSDSEASHGEVFAHDMKSRHRKVVTSLADLMGAGLAEIRDQLPDQQKIVDLVAVRDYKRETVVFAPQYPKSDPAVDNSPSMRFFYAKDKRELIPGKKYRAEEISAVRTGKLNARGVEIVEVAVRIL